MLICYDQRSGNGCGAENVDGAAQCPYCGQNLRFALHLHNPGTLVRYYQILRIIGFGGFGAVYEAENTHAPGTRVALKESFDPGGIANFQGEFAALQRLQHPHLPRYEAMFVEHGSGYLVMELIIGKNLEDVQDEEGGELPETQVLGFALQLCNVLSYLHHQPSPIIHRDIKPANIRLTPNGRIKLVDFGLFKQGINTTKSSRIGLTPAYAPVEQHPLALGHTDERSDIYSLGATLYHLLTGQIPVSSFDRIKTTTDPLVPLAHLTPQISAHIATTISRAMSLKPGDRYPDIETFRQSLVGQDLLPNIPSVPTRSIPKANPNINAVKAAINWIIGVFVGIVGGITGIIGSFLVLVLLFLFISSFNGDFALSFVKNIGPFWILTGIGGNIIGSFIRMHHKANINKLFYSNIFLDSLMTSMSGAILGFLIGLITDQIYAQFTSSIVSIIAGVFPIMNVTILRFFRKKPYFY